MKLRRLKEEDVAGMLEWMHDPEINCNFRFNAKDMTTEKSLSFIKKANKDFDEGTAYNFAIADENDEYLGTISLKEVSYNDKTAEYAVSLRKKAQGQGVAYWATKEILKYAFETLGLNRVYLNVLSENARAIRLYEKSGFIYEGEFRNHLCLRGNYKSLKWYGILKQEYDNNATK